MGHISDRWYVGKGQARKPSARHGKGLRWQVWYSVDGREKYGGSFKVKAVAERTLTELEGRVLRGAWVDPTNTTTVAEWMRTHAQVQSHSPRTATRLDTQIRNHIEPTTLGGRRLSKLRPSEAQAWVSDRAKVLAPSTLARLVSAVRRALRAARADNLMVGDPFENVVLPSVVAERIVPLTSEQVAALAELIGPRYRALVIAQAGLGLRIGEVLALRVQDIDWLRRTVRVHYQIDQDTSQLVKTKTPRSRRTLPLPDVVAAELSAHIGRCPPGERAGWEGLIFHTRVGTPLLRQDYRTRAFTGAVRRAHAADESFPLATTPHALRHHYVSVLLTAGESVVAVAELLGHENATLVMTTYGHLMPGREEHARRAINAAFGSIADRPDDSVTTPPRPERR
ncbi:MAG TPA: tyrosine-type recombinase/integrase [Pseudonocardia sp.]|jgi:integrase